MSNEHTIPIEELPGYHLVASTRIEPSCFKLLYATIWGSEDVYYRQLDMPGEYLVPRGTDKKIEMYSIIKDDDPSKALACICIYPKRVDISSRSFPASYISHYAVDKSLVSQGLGKRVLGFALKTSGNLAPKSNIFYAYIEKTNYRSIRSATWAGFERVGEFYFLTFGRIFPRVDPRVELLPPYLYQTLLSNLQASYKNHALTDFEHSLLPNNYYVIRDKNGEILAGVQCHLRHWRITKLAGISGAIAINVIPNIPLINRLFRKNFRHLKFGNIYLRPGYETTLESLLNDLLHRYQVYVGTLYLDKKSWIYSSIKQHVRLSLTNDFTETPADIIMDTKQLAPDILSSVQTQPIFVSPIDF